MSETGYNSQVSISQDNLDGDLVIPLNSKGIILFAHGSGSSRTSARNKYIAKILNDHGFATLLVDLLTEREKQIDITTKHLRFDIELLTNRLLTISDWLCNNQSTKSLSMGYFSSSTGTAAALNASAKIDNVRAIVSRGGRPDLVENSILDSLTCPSLFIIGGKDEIVINITKKLFKVLPNTKLHNLVIIPKASHLFEEQGKIDEVVEFAVRWFKIHLLKENDQKPLKRYRNFSLIPSFDHKRISVSIKFKDRVAAGYTLAHILYDYKNQHNVMVMGIARGGAVVADVVAKKLNIDDFNVILSRKLRAPDNSEEAIGVVLHDNSVYLDYDAILSKEISSEYVKMEISCQTKEMRNKLLKYGSAISRIKISDKTIILVDDGVATGSTITAASKWIKGQNPAMLITALPVIPQKKIELLSGYSNIIKFIRSPRNFNSVDEFYKDFSQVDDDTLREILEKRDLI